MTEIVSDASEGQARIQAVRWIHPKKITFWESIAPRVLIEEESVRGIDTPSFKFIYHCA